ncbi:MAG TPA: RcnB family protein [Rhizomicrobium sp.]|jgi:Ni/Co efflux regulator RcnB|nr:RcnB family protein [Rhizomicrobium sp.]
MKKFLTTAAAVLMIAAPMSEAFAQGWNNRHDDRRDDRRGSMMMRGHDNYGHRNWRKGNRIERHDWNRGHRVDYRRYKLQRPPRGYEWRRVDNSYILAAAATGLIASVILAGR